MIGQAVMQLEENGDAHPVHHDDQAATGHGDRCDALVKRVLDRNQRCPVWLIGGQRLGETPIEQVPSSTRILAQ